MLVEIILGALGKTGVGYAATKGFERFKSRSAKKELAEIGATAVEAAAHVLPGLAEDLRSESFVKGAFVPMLEALVKDPSNLPDPQGLASRFIDMFVARFAGVDGVDEALVRIFHTPKTDLVPAFGAMLTSLRSHLYSSKHWRELAHQAAGEQTLANTETILGILGRMDTAASLAQVDITVAKHDASVGSSELRDWPKDIAGQHIFRPELNRLLNHVEGQPPGTSLLIGEAGSGKSALLADLTSSLEDRGAVVFAIKADLIPPEVEHINDIGKAFGMDGPLDLEIAALAAQGRVVLIIDQLDAVSDVMDRSSARMRLLLRLVRHVRERSLPVHVIVSSRPFEAAHDARFQQLKAEEFRLELPSVDQVLELLAAVGVKREDLDPSLHQTLRRPFALRLFVDLVQRGVEVSSLIAWQLLDRWLATADLGTDSQRRDALALMESLAAEMVETETLWRPVDVFEARSKEALARCEACGLVVRSGGKIGFSHQSWLDDFQAKGFRSGSHLAEYAWRNQDSLFVRATVLRSLQRLRTLDERAYATAVSALLGAQKTRRHLKHLLVDVISANPTPTVQEGAWLETLIRSDHVLASRGLGKVVDHWEAWRSLLRKTLPALMQNDDFQWRAIQLLAAEARFDAEHVTDLITTYWNDADKDGVVFRVIEQSGVITPKVEELIGTILSRTQIDQYAISHFVSTLRAEGRTREASRVTALWISTTEVTRHSSVQLHDIEKLAEAAPLEFAQELLPWFVKIASSEVEPFLPGLLRFPKSSALPWDWNFDREHGSVFEAFRSAIRALAALDPDEAKRIIQTLSDVEIEQAQEIAAEALTAGAHALAQTAYDFLLADERRFHIGDAHVTLEPGLSSIESGLCSQDLIEAISSHLPDALLLNLRDRIEAWSLYGPEMSAGSDAAMKRERLRWADQHRMELLERLPARIVPPRRRRQIREWRGVRRRPVGRANIGGMATFVGSPMSPEAMGKASDEAVLRMLDEVCDTSPEHTRRRPISMDGGVVQLSRAFGAFAKDQPERAFSIAEKHLQPGRHEHAAGQMVEELSKTDFPPERLIGLIHLLSKRGFASSTWKHNASWALARMAEHPKGLDDNTISLLESWLENDPEQIERDIDARLSNEASNAERNRKDRTLPEPVLFNRHGGMRIVPQNNYTILSAIFHGLLSRIDKDYDAWLTILETHALEPEDPNIWTSILMFEGHWLYWADRERVTALIGQLWASDRRIFDDVDLLPSMWGTRAMFPASMLRELCASWLESSDERKIQGAAEFVQVGLLVAPDDPLFIELAEHLSDEPSPILTGRLFSAAAAWREEDRVLRARAHALLMQFGSTAAGDQAHAISGAVDKTDHLAADELTRELILAVADNPILLASSLTGRFADGLQSLLLYPGFDDTVLYVTEKIADLIIGDRGGQHRGWIDKDFVHVSVALQRNEGPLRARAMDVYERLLDAGAYGAEEAAKDAAGR